MLWLADAQTEYQSGLDVGSLAREGYSGLIVKATQSAGGYSAPARFDAWLDTARASGMVPGAYHWLDGSSGVAQAERFVSRLGRHLDGPLLIAVDNEDPDWPAPTQVLEAWVWRMRQLVGDRPIGHYSGAWWARPHLGGYRVADLGLWCWDSWYISGSAAASTLYEQVGDNMWVPRYGGWPRTTLLQYSSEGCAGGLVANLDVDAFAGSANDLWQLAGASASGERRQGMIFHNGLPAGRSYVAVVGPAVIVEWDLIANLIDAGVPQFELPPAAFTKLYGELRKPTAAPAALTAEDRAAIAAAVVEATGGRVEQIASALDAAGTALAGLRP